MSTEPQPGTLYIVGTPIGNLEDITLRAIKILQNVNLIAAEDTRHTGKLLHHLQISTPQISFHGHNQVGRIPELLEKLTAQNSIALVSDAGMPGISDPGYELVKACVDAGIKVVPIPGVSASLTGLSASGLPTNRFIFDGFLAAKGQKRREHLQDLLQEFRTIILYEAPHRLRLTLEDLAQILGEDRQIVIARELTKIHEEFWRGSLKEAMEYYQDREPKGEYTLIIAGAEIVTTELSEIEIKEELKILLDEGVSKSQASRQLAQKTNLSRQEIYQIALNI